MLLMCFRTDAARELLEGWNLSINAEPARMPGRVLPAEEVFQGQNTRVSSSN